MRQVKRREPDFRFKSFMVELICAHLADDGLRMSDYPVALEHIFTYIVQSELRDRIGFTDYYEAGDLPDPTGAAIELFDPVNPDNNVAARYTTTERDAIVEAAADALDALSEAAYAEGKGRAVERWQVLLGPTFKGN